jgi:hypothetical protein
VIVKESRGTTQVADHSLFGALVLAIAIEYGRILESLNDLGFRRHLGRQKRVLL